MSDQLEPIKPLKKGAVVYPRSYHYDSENPLNSYIEGVTQGGQEIVAYLRVGEEHKERQGSDGNGKTVPSIKDLNAKNPTAPRRCEASSDNGPDKPEKGILLVEQINKLEGEEAQRHPGKFVCEAKWVSILQQSSYLPAKMTKGYVEIAFHPKLSPDQMRLKAQFIALKNKLEGQNADALSIKEEMQVIQREMIESRRMFLTLVDMDIENTMTYSLAEMDSVPPQNRIATVKDALKEALESRTESGMYGGAILRLRTTDTVSPLYTSAIAMRFDYKAEKKNAIVPFEDIFQTWSRFDGSKLLSVFSKASANSGLILDIIPVQRSNIGWKSLDLYQKDILRLESSKTLKTYVDDSARMDVGVLDLTVNDYLVSFMANRTAITEEENILISRTHSYTAPMVKAALFANNMTKYKMSNPDKSQQKRAA